MERYWQSATATAEVYRVVGSDRRRVLELEDPTPDQVARMLDVFRDSFAGEPGFRYMFTNPERRLADVRWAAGLKFALLRDRLRVFVAGPAIEGFSWWIPPGRTPFATFAEQIRAGYGWAPVRCGPWSFLRMFRFSSQERDLIAHYTSRPVWVLDAIAVDLSLGRRGLGGRLLEPGLRAARRSGHDCFVLTHNERNVHFYEKHGFRLDRTERLGRAGVSAYCLLHDADRIKGQP